MPRIEITGWSKGFDVTRCVNVLHTFAGLSATRRGVWWSAWSMVSAKPWSSKPPTMRNCCWRR